MLLFWDDYVLKSNLKGATCFSLFPTSLKSNVNFLLWNKYVGGGDGKDSSYKLLGNNYSILLWNIYHQEFSIFGFLFLSQYVLLF